MREPLVEDQLTERLDRTLTPVRPPEVFRDHLRNNLALASRQQKMRRGWPRRKQLDWSNWWLAMALILTSLTAGTFFAYLIRYRLLDRPPL